MPLSQERAVEQAQILYESHVNERRQLDKVRLFYKGRQRLPVVIKVGSPREVRQMAASSRVNVMPIVVNSLVQSAFVDGVRDAQGEPLGVWKAWQANRFDARQTAVHRSAAQYGCGYVVCTPGDTSPVMRTVSPRSMATLYGEDPDWPMWALERLGHGAWRLYDEDHVYFLSGDPSKGTDFTYVETRVHGAGVVPVVRFLDEMDDDDEDEPWSEALATPDSFDLRITRGQIVPLMPLQDQIDLTTFALQVAQHYGAFKQRYIIGWMADDERELIKTGAGTLMTFDKEPGEMQVGEFTQTNVSGYIASREATLRHAASLSQTPVHELIGDLVNMSAEALAAAEAGKDRKVDERETIWGEAHEQVFWLAGQYMGVRVEDDVQVVWRDTSARSFAATVDGLGKLAALLGIPQEELWERIPGVTQQDVERFKAAAAVAPQPAPTGGVLDPAGNPLT